jgi:hypothetical protein
MKIEFPRRFSEKYSVIKFNENPSKWEPSSSMQTYGQTDLSKLIVALRSFAKDIASEDIQPVKRLSFSWTITRTASQQTVELAHFSTSDTPVL